jgi:hypothetical protein
MELWEDLRFACRAARGGVRRQGEVRNVRNGAGIDAMMKAVTGRFAPLARRLSFASPQSHAPAAELESPCRTKELDAPAD